MDQRDDIFITIAAEQFGTNIRATVATTVPNLSAAQRCAGHQCVSILKAHKVGGTPLGPVTSAALVGAACLLIAFWAWSGLEETHGKDLDYLELLERLIGG